MKRKLKSESGVTLVEMLCAIAILVLLCLMLNTGLQAAIKSYRNVTAQSELELLCSTVSNLLADDLRLARDVKVDGENKLQSYNSDSYGTAATIEIDDEGRITIGGNRILPDGTYGNGAYKAENLTISYDGTDFDISLRVQQKSGRLHAEANFTVRCLNGEKAEGEETI